MSRPRFSRLALLLPLASAIALGACDKGDSTPPADGGETPAPDPMSAKPTHDVSLPTPEAVCEHILTVVHAELGHLDEMDAAREAAAVAECAQRVKADRERFGVAFAPIPECVFVAETLEAIAECEDHYARDLVADDAHTAITQLSLEEPIVDTELCMHWAHIATGKAVDTKECRSELIKVREHVGNVVFDHFAKCMMDSANEAEFYECRTKADTHAVKRRERPGDASVIPDATPADALEMLVTLERQTCSCTNADCAHLNRDALDMWIIAYADAGGNAQESEQAERFVASLIKCERDIVGDHWVED